MDKEGKETILLGDTKCDVITNQVDKPVDNDTRHATSRYELFSFNQFVKEPTRVTSDTSSIIDHIAKHVPGTSSNLECMKNFNEQAFLSDVIGINWGQMLNPMVVGLSHTSFFLFGGGKKPPSLTFDG